MKSTVLLILMALVLTACAGSSASPAATAQQYFQSIVDGDEEKIATLSCADWEASARSDVAAFGGVEARLEGVTCDVISSSDSEAVVGCGGAIVATYNNEDQSFELTGKELKLVQQNGEWLVCGYNE